MGYLYEDENGKKRSTYAEDEIYDEKLTYKKYYKEFDGTIVFETRDYDSSLGPNSISLKFIPKNHHRAKLPKFSRVENYQRLLTEAELFEGNAISEDGYFSDTDPLLFVVSWAINPKLLQKIFEEKCESWLETFKKRADQQIEESKILFNTDWRIPGIGEVEIIENGEILL